MINMSTMGVLKIFDKDTIGGCVFEVTEELFKMLKEHREFMG